MRNWNRKCENKRGYLKEDSWRSKTMTQNKSAIQKKSVPAFMTLLQSLIFFAFHFQNFESLLKTTYYSQSFYCGEFSYHEDQKQ